MQRIRLTGPLGPIRSHLHITGSKSISNRVLLIRALSQKTFDISNLSKSDDTVTLDKLLQSTNDTFDAHHAGTTFRFMTAYLSIQKGRQILTGSDRMLERPIGPLVDALRQIGANIEYNGKEGYPPLAIDSFEKQKSREITIQADMSSQFISALCMLAPVLEQGLVIHLKGDLVSRPYLEMTLSIMHDFGIESSFSADTITVEPQAYKGKNYLVESDWSSASYHFAIASISKDCEIQLSHYFQESYQGDSKITEMSKAFGVESIIESDVLTIQSGKKASKMYSYDFIRQPDLAQTIAVMAAANGISASYNGLKTLAIKETDRVKALTIELKKTNINISKSENPLFEYVQEGQASFIDEPIFDTYKDHRMAMCLAPLSLLHPIQINNPDVVSKSYPSFWKDLKQLGFEITYL